MKTLTKSVLLTFMLVFTLACSQGKKEETTEMASQETVAEAPAAVLNANLASEEELKGLGLSDEMVGQIVEARPFMTLNDFVSVIGDDNATEEMFSKIFVPMNLNITAEEDFKIIPGVGDRMAHEFEEYRPYTSIEQFRREIGKYVDEEEVARYESYVFVPAELNTASEETIKALPGVGSKMVHEFEEYRPYDDMDRFYQEIGKYVDDKELERLARLVYIADN